MSSNHQPIIIKKIVHGHHGHHGGAWKVAYADFVTAMMAFFLVMWIVGQSKAVKQSVAAYFRDPGAFTEGGRGVLPGAESGATGGPQAATGSNVNASPDVDAAKRALEQAAQRLRAVIEAKFGTLKDRVEIRVTDEGLLIELREAPDDGFFPSGSAVPKQETIDVLAAIGAELGKLPNKVAIEGHTDRRPYARPDGYSNWELSADRANAARRVLSQKGLRGDQVEAVRGYADTRPRTPKDPFDAGNRRISIVVRRLDVAPMPEGDVSSVQPRAPGTNPKEGLRR
jgi:chemotaxis protein MotB